MIGQKGLILEGINFWGHSFYPLPEPKPLQDIRRMICILRDSDNAEQRNKAKEKQDGAEKEVGEEMRADESIIQDMFPRPFNYKYYFEF